jgi:hypothetical protein
VIILPGGGYSHLAIDKEGTKVAEWLNSLGIVAFVLKYRLPSDLNHDKQNRRPVAGCPGSHAHCTTKRRKMEYRSE